MITAKLDEGERRLLQKLKNTRSTLGKRISYILLSDEGLSVRSIAQRLRRHEHTIRSWIKAYINQGINGLRSKTPPGRTRIKGQQVEEGLEKFLVKSPRDFGYQEEGWTVTLMIDLFLKREINVKEDTIRRVLKRNGWVYKRFAKSVPKNSPSKEEKRDKIKKLVHQITLDKPDEVFFVDEANFMTGPYVQRGWFKQGEKKKLIVQ